jgi:hypothetical protein
MPSCGRLYMNPPFLVPALSGAVELRARALASLSIRGQNPNRLVCREYGGHEAAPPRYGTTRSARGRHRRWPPPSHARAALEKLSVVSSTSLLSHRGDKPTSAALGAGGWFAG